MKFYQQNPTLKMLVNFCRGLMFCAALFFTAYFGFVVILPLYLVTLFTCGRTFTDTMEASWFLFVAGMYELLMGVEVKIIGDISKLRQDRGSLIIMNHRTRLDWLFYASVQARYGTLKRFKIFLKSVLKHIPGAGWGMQLIGFIFLGRNWKQDREHIDKLLSYFDKLKYRTQLLFFPEGTNLTPYTKELSDRFAQQHGYQIFNHVLCPRTTGFTYLVQRLQRTNNRHQLVDVTIAYPYDILENESDIFWLGLPKMVVFKIDVLEITDLPNDTEEINDWLRQRWSDKDKFLELFYARNLITAIENKIVYQATNQVLENDIEKSTRLLMILIITVWTVFTVLSFLVFLSNHILFWYVVIMSIVCTVISTCVGFERALGYIQ